MSNPQDRILMEPLLEDMNNPDKIMDNKEDIMHLQPVLLHKAVMNNNQEVETDRQITMEHKEGMTKHKGTVNNNQEVMLSKVDFLNTRWLLVHLFPRLILDVLIN